MHKDCQACKLNMEDTVDHNRWMKEVQKEWFIIMTGFPLTWQTLEFYVRPGIFGMISRFTLVLTQ